MRNRKNLFMVLSILMMTVAIIAAMGINNVSAQPEPEIVIYPELQTGKVGDPLTGFVMYQVNIRNAPHTDEEVVTWDVDKTWAWEVDIRWDPTVLDCALSDYIIEDRDWTVTPGVYAWFGYFKTWTYKLGKWIASEYPNTFKVSLDRAAGYAKVGCTLSNDVNDPTLKTVPAGNPQAGLHLGSYYDLPYTAGLPGDAYYPPNELNLFWIGFDVLKDGPPAYSRIYIEKATFFCHDMKTTYAVTPMDAWFGLKPIPEFPLGVGLMIMLAPAIPIVYLWRTRKKVVKQ